MIDSNINTSTSVRANEFLQNFFGVNIFAEPNDFWHYEGRYDGKNERYIFINNDLKDNLFKKCKAIVFKSGATTFLWEPIPYDEFIPYQIALKIERDLLGNVNMTLSQCLQKYEIKSSTSSFQIKYGEYTINIDFGFDKKEIGLVLWTRLAKNELANKVYELYPDKTLIDPNDPISKENFLRNFFGVDIINSPDKSWEYLGFKDGETPHFAFYRKGLDNDLFNSCYILAVKNGGTLFSWENISTKDAKVIIVAKRIHQNLFGEDLSLAAYFRKYEDAYFNNKSIEIVHENMKITIKVDSPDEFHLVLWTNLDKTEMINKLLTNDT
jgi:hypothetical protein